MPAFRRSTFLRSGASLVALVSAATFACGGSGASPSDGAADAGGSSSSPEGGDATSNGTSDTGADGGASDAESRVPPCDPSETATLQYTLEHAVPEGADAVAVVRDESCGERFFTIGPSQYPKTVLHRVASNTKTYVASVVLLLAEQGLLDLNAPVSQWIDGVPGGDAIKVHHLLNHTSGLYNFTADLGAEAASATGRTWTPRDLLDISFDHAVDFQAGQGMGYSNTNYVALGIIAEKVAGAPIHVLLRERILDVVGATSTFFDGSESWKGSTLAVGRSATGADFSYFNHPSFDWCDGNVVATPTDLALWVEKRGNGSFHSAAVQAELQKTVAFTGHPGFSMGPGMIVLDAGITRGAGPGYGHGGDTWGYHSMGFYFPSRRSTVVVIVDDDRGPDGNFPLAESYSETIFFAALETLYGAKDGGP